MCGIIGYIGYDNAKNVLIKGLKSLEYRGYDSAGIAVLKNNKCEITKCKGRVSALEEKVKNIEATAGIGHTRWATHGKVSDENSTLTNSVKLRLCTTESLKTMRHFVTAWELKQSLKVKQTARLSPHLLTGSLKNIKTAKRQ